MNTEGGSITVLHVDDEPDFGELVQIHLERVADDMSVATESDPFRALERLERDSFDCVVSDHDMPEMNGLELLKSVRADYPDLPFILFTGKGSEEIASDAISAGVTEYIQKRRGTEHYTVLANRIERAVGEKRAEEALEESERRLSTLISNLPGIVYRCRNEQGWPMEFVSEGAEKISGYDSASLERGEVDWEALIADAERDRVRQTTETCLDADEPFEVTYPIETRDGERRWVWERGRKVDETATGAAIIEGFITDITVPKEREMELERERAFTERLTDAVDDSFYLLDADGTLLRWNDAVSEATGYTDEELVGMSAFDFIDDSHERTVEAAIARTLETGEAQFEAPVVGKDGTRVPYEFRGSSIRESDDDRIGIAGIGRDISDRTDRERKLERYETIVEAVGDPVYALDTDGVFTYVNEAIEGMTGYTPEELVGQHIGVIMTDEDVKRGEELIRDLLDAESDRHATMEMDVVTRDGDHVPCENNMAVLQRADREFSGTAGVIRDIAERKERERRLAEFASVVSHDLRSPLNVVQGRIDLVRETGEVGHLEHAAAGAERMEELIDDLLTLARTGETISEINPVDLEVAATEAWKAVDAPGATLAFAETTVLEADAARLRELLENLFRNSVEHGSTSSRTKSDDSLEHGGEDVTVTVGTLAEDEGFYVADDGPGIPASKRDEVFERGHTTSVDGTGFGLAIVEDIADAHGWTVDLTTSHDGGARFEFRTSRPGQ